MRNHEERTARVRGVCRGSNQMGRLPFRSKRGLNQEVADGAVVVACLDV